MTEQKKKAFFEELLKQAKQITEAARLSDNAPYDGGTMLTALFSTVSDGSGVCTFETELIEAFEGEPQVEILVTMPFEVADDDAFVELMDAVINMNFYVPMGAFGFHNPSERMFFRYTGFVDDKKSVADMAADVIELYKKIAMVIGNVFAPLERIATGESDYETEAEDGVLPEQE